MTADQGELFATPVDASTPAALRLADPLEGPGQARRTDPDTSHAAAAFVTASATSARVRLARAFGAAGDAGLTAEDAARTGGLSLASEYATRASELMRLGVIAPTGERRPGRAGLDRVVYAVTVHGLELLAARADA